MTSLDTFSSLLPLVFPDTPPQRLTFRSPELVGFGLQAAGEEEDLEDYGRWSVALPDLAVFLSDAAYGYRSVEIVESLGEVLAELSEHIPDLWGASGKGSVCFIGAAAAISLTLTRADEDSWLSYATVLAVPVTDGIAVVFLSQVVDFAQLGAQHPPAFPTDPRPAVVLGLDSLPGTGWSDERGWYFGV